MDAPIDTTIIEEVTAAGRPTRAARRSRPLQRRRCEIFKAHRRGYWSLWIFLFLFVISLFAEFIVGAVAVEHKRHRRGGADRRAPPAASRSRRCTIDTGISAPSRAVDPEPRRRRSESGRSRRGHLALAQRPLCRPRARRRRSSRARRAWSAPRGRSPPRTRGEPEDRRGGHLVARDDAAPRLAGRRRRGRTAPSRGRIRTAALPSRRSETTRCPANASTPVTRVPGPLRDQLSVERRRRRRRARRGPRSRSRPRRW